ncbi:MAG TPA: N-carbamoylputrescine amidase [Thermoleophilia bacterium]|nr:N-carbamoylputrescine amidase [Thermoleophilia bacterium]
MARAVTIAATQMACSWEIGENIDRAESLVREAASRGAQVVLLQELFETPYFCIDQSARHFDLARPVDGHPTVERFQRLAAELGVVLPVSIFERAGQAFFNSLVMIDADGAALGIYRKTHIPHAVGYHEKYYFSPGDTGFRVWRTRHGVLGVGICWDQWFPESARSMALMGAEVLLYPTAIGSDPPAPEEDSSGAWLRVQQGHAAANLMPLVASNRIGVEDGDSASMRFYGSSFIADQTGAIVAQASSDQQEVVTAAFDLDEVRRYRERWAMFRDRRPELYGRLLTLDGESGGST